MSGARKQAGGQEGTNVPSYVPFRGRMIAQARRLLPVSHEGEPMNTVSVRTPAQDRDERAVVDRIRTIGIAAAKHAGVELDLVEDCAMTLLARINRRCWRAGIPLTLGD